MTTAQPIKTENATIKLAGAFQIAPSLFAASHEYAVLWGGAEDRAKVAKALRSAGFSVKRACTG